MTAPASLEDRLAGEGLAASSWSNGPHETYASHAHAYDKVIVVATGSISFGLSGEGRRIALDAGDRLDLPAGTAHDAVVGAAGVRCLEAHQPAGAVPAIARHAAGSW